MKPYCNNIILLRMHMSTYMCRNKPCRHRCIKVNTVRVKIASRNPNFMEVHIGSSVVLQMVLIQRYTKYVRTRGGMLVVYGSV